MASVQKFTMAALPNQIRHINREIQDNANRDIDSSRSGQNYVLSPDRGKPAYQYFKERKKQLHCMNRSDVKVAAGWCVTAPKDLPCDKHRDFFQETYNFLSERYGGTNNANTLLCTVHNDEAGQPHMHYVFVPTVHDGKLGMDKICAKEVLTRTELKKFHPELQKHLSDKGMAANVNSGITRENGGNRTVRELKESRNRSKWEMATYSREHEGRSKWDIS